MDYQPLFNYLHKQHNLILLEQEMQEICHIVNKMQLAELCKTVKEKKENAIKIK